MTKDSTPPVSRDSDKFMLRLPDGMRAQISKAAKANSRSMNAEIVARLESSFEAKPQTAADDFNTGYLSGLLSATRNAARLLVKRLKKEKASPETIEEAQSIDSMLSILFRVDPKLKEVVPGIYNLIPEEFKKSWNELHDTPKGEDKKK